MIRYFFKLVIPLLCLPLLLRAQIKSSLDKQFPPQVVARIKAVTNKVELPVEKQVLLGRYFAKQDSLGKAAVMRGAPADEIQHYFTNSAQDLGAILSPLELNDFLFTKASTASKYATALKFRTTLDLTKVQIDSLLNQLNTQSSIKGKANAETKKKENDHLSSILTKEQYFGLLSIINKDKAQGITTTTWNEIKQLGLSKGLDSAKEQNQILKFETEQIVALDLNANSRKPVRPDSIRRSMVVQEPFALLKLNAYNNKLPASQFATALRYRTEIELTDTQIDTLLHEIIALETLKTRNKAENIPEFTGAKELEADVLIKLFSELQMHHYLFYKVQGKAIANTKKDWEKLKQFGLTQGVDSLAVNKDNLTYEINFNIASERYAMDNSQQNLFNRKDVESKKPDLLKKADIANKNLEVNTTAKKTLTW